MTEPPPMIHRVTTEKVTVNRQPVLRVTLLACDGAAQVIELPTLPALRLATSLVEFINHAVTDMNPT